MLDINVLVMAMVIVITVQLSLQATRSWNLQRPARLLCELEYFGSLTDIATGRHWPD